MVIHFCNSNLFAILIFLLDLNTLCPCSGKLTRQVEYLKEELGSEIASREKSKMEVEELQKALETASETRVGFFYSVPLQKILFRLPLYMTYIKKIKLTTDHRYLLFMIILPMRGSAKTQNLYIHLTDTEDDFGKQISHLSECVVQAASVSCNFHV